MDSILKLNNDIFEKRERFLKRVKDNLEISKVGNKLSSFYDYDFKMFIGELKKKKIKLSLIEQDQWEEYFSEYKQQINALQLSINKLETNIDKVMYQLYDLDSEKINLIEKANA